jgi:arsenate reductase (thioredoxin)
VTGFLGQNIGYLVTVCDSAKEKCPIFPRAFRKLHWSLDDPSAATGAPEDKLAAFRRVRNELENHIREFVAQSS